VEWEWVAHRLANDPIYWLVTASPGSWPTARPLWGVWLDERVLFQSGSPRHRRDFEANPKAVIHLGSGAEVVIVEGVIEVLRDPAADRRFVEAYKRKYDFDLVGFRAWLAELNGEEAGHDEAEVQTLVPQSVFAWTDSGGGYVPDPAAPFANREYIPGSGMPNRVAKWVFTSHA